MPRIISSSRWLVLFAVVLLAVGCKKKLPAPDSVGPAPTVGNSGPPLTEEDCQKFGEELETAVAHGDKAAVDRLLRLGSMVERSISDFDLTANEKKNLLAGASTGADKFSENFIAQVKNGGAYSVLRTRTIDGRPRVIFRMLAAEGAVNYHEFTLARYPDGQVATEDIHIYLSGEPLTQTFRRLILGFIAERNRGSLTRLSPSEQLLTKHIPDLLKMGQQLRNGQHKESLATFRGLPEALQKNKIFQIVAVQAAMGTGDDKEYLVELERFRRDHPTDPAGDLISIDYYVIKKNYDETLKLIDRLNDSLGGDPYLVAMKAGVLADAGKFKEARALAEKVIEEAPKMPQTYWNRVTIATKEKDHVDTLKWLKILVEKAEPKLEPDNLSADDRFVEFVKTPQFRDFKKWLATREK